MYRYRSFSIVSAEAASGKTFESLKFQQTLDEEAADVAGNTILV